MNKLRILLVEDCPQDQRKLVCELVERGFDVVLECDGIAAIQRVHQASTPFDLICLDIQLDLVAARFTASVLRAIGYRGPIFTLSPCSIPADCEQCHYSGCTGCVSRAKAPAEFVAVLNAKRARSSGQKQSTERNQLA